MTPKEAAELLAKKLYAKEPLDNEELNLLHELLQIKGDFGGGFLLLMALSEERMKSIVSGELPNPYKT